ncbi:CDP-glucose 4,6-dehydratase [Pedobacter hiemivivus]|uniref:CDP-glucose 4,6-dehydratase n=1 Tax=Pedobacter hiemivivus TaxID=2530454 RepID=A0A4R0N8F0_9SPHI|nr:CDP-glucose 4,6-dehydratase [Pedobacter hiemivivus]TCC96370.1 CDP-glucose 4,6-dehydratase [Pedobacter hiemivivus]
MLSYLKEIYQGKKIFLTGHTGFKGSWLLKTLHILGAEVKGYALKAQTENDLYCLINGDKICNSVIGDLRDRDALKNAVLDFQPDFIFHLAAQPLVRLSYEIPSETFEVNAVGTANLLDAIRLLEKACSVILITTDKVYHNNEWEYPYRENDRLGGYDPYSASKACAELVIDSYRNSFFNIAKYDIHKKGIAIGRAGNVIGGGDWSKDRLIPDLAKALGANEQILIRNPKSVRPWQHVLEPVIAYLLLGAHLNSNPIKFSQAYNFGPYVTDALPVLDMLNLLINSWGRGTYKIEKSENPPHEAGLLKLDISKAIADLNWTPKMNASLAVEMTTSWYKAFFDNPKFMSEFTNEQILKYLNL